MKLHPNTQDFDVADPAVVTVVAEATALGLPVLFDSGIRSGADVIKAEDPGGDPLRR